VKVKVVEEEPLAAKYGGDQILNEEERDNTEDYLGYLAYMVKKA
jgi:hypothetical protein